MLQCKTYNSRPAAALARRLRQRCHPHLARPVKFQPETAVGVNIIGRHDHDRIVVGAQAFAHSLIVPWMGEVRRWDVDHFQGLSAVHFEQLVSLQPELVLLGSGLRQRLAPPVLVRALIERGIGFEAMDTAAACRTYNVLASERRKVVAALILEIAA